MPFIYVLKIKLYIKIATEGQMLPRPQRTSDVREHFLNFGRVYLSESI